MSFTLTSTSTQHNYKTSTVLLTPSRKRKLPSDNLGPKSFQSSLKDIWSWTLSADSIAPCFVRDALTMKGNTEEGLDFFWLGSIPCRSVKIVGIVIGLQVFEKRVIYSVDDGTSVIDCTHQQPALSSPKKRAQPLKTEKPATLQPPELPKPAALIGHFVCISGMVKTKYESRQIMVSSIERCNPNDELHHFQEVRRLHQVSYSRLEPFIIPARTIQSAEFLTPSNIATPSSVFSSPAKSEASHSSPIKSPRKLRHPSRLHSRDLIDNTFRIYLKHYMDNAPDIIQPEDDESGYDTDGIYDNSLIPSTPTKRSRHDMESTPRMTQKLSTDQTPRPNITPLRFGPSKLHHFIQNRHRDDKNPRGFTLSYLRRVPELREMARRVVLAEAKKRLREERKKMKEAKASQTRSQRHSSSVVMERDKLAIKMKRLFTWALVQLLKEGCIIIWDGPHRPIPADETPSISGLWKANTSGNSTMEADSSIFGSLSGSTQTGDEFVDDGDLSDPQPTEEVYMPLKPAMLADEVEKMIKRLCAHPKTGNVRKQDLRKPPPEEPEGGCTKQQILALLRRDDRWRYVGDWNIDDALDLLNKEDRAWCIGHGQWDIAL